jgi:hypothetical protein
MPSNSGRDSDVHFQRQSAYTKRRHSGVIPRVRGKLPFRKNGWWRMQSVSNLSPRGIPCEQGKEQGIFTFSTILEAGRRYNRSRIIALAVGFPIHQNREFDSRNRESRATSSENM